MKYLCSRKKIMFIEYNNICFDDLSEDGTHLMKSGKTILGSNFFSDVNRVS